MTHRAHARTAFCSSPARHHCRYFTNRIIRASVPYCSRIWSRLLISVYWGDLFGLIGTWLEQNGSSRYVRIPVIIKAGSDGAPVAFCKSVLLKKELSTEALMFHGVQANSVEHVMKTPER